MDWGHGSLGKTLMVLGGVIFLVGLIVWAGGKLLPLGRLPGDIHWQRDSFSFHFPVVTSLVISIILTIVLNILFRR